MKVSFSGTTFDDEGFKCLNYFGKRIYWQDVEFIHFYALRTGSDGPQYCLVIDWGNSNERLLLEFLRGNRNFDKLREILEMIRAHLSHEFFTEQMSFFLEWVRTHKELDDLKKRAKNISGNMNLIKRIINISFVRLNDNDVMKYAEKALQLDPNDIDVNMTLASLDSEHCKFDKAVERYRSLAKHSPDNIRVANRLAISLLASDDEEGVNFAQRALDMNEDFDVQGHLAEYYFRKKEYDKSLQTYQLILSKLKDEKMKKGLSQRIDYITRYSTDKSFQRTEHRKILLDKIILWGLIGAVVIFGILALISEFLTG